MRFFLCGRERHFRIDNYEGLILYLFIMIQFVNPNQEIQGPIIWRTDFTHRPRRDSYNIPPLTRNLLVKTRTVIGTRMVNISESKNSELRYCWQLSSNAGKSLISASDILGLEFFPSRNLLDKK